MRTRGQRAIAFATVLLIASASLAQAQSNRRVKKQQEQAAPASAPADKRDRLVTTPGSPFQGKAYWQAAAQCGGIYYKLGTIHSEAAVRAKVVKPDPAAYTQATKDADSASRAATALYEVAERVLIADRKITRDEAVLTYDPLSGSSGDRVKSVEAANQMTKPCPDFYKACRAAFPQVCNDPAALPN